MSDTTGAIIGALISGFAFIVGQYIARPRPPSPANNLPRTDEIARHKLVRWLYNSIVVIGVIVTGFFVFKIIQQHQRPNDYNAPQYAPARADITAVLGGNLGMKALYDRARTTNSLFQAVILAQHGGACPQADRIRAYGEDRTDMFVSNWLGTLNP